MAAKKKIMVVDDDETTVQFLNTLLGLNGHEVICAHSGPECLELVRTEKPDIILLDIMMTEMSGWDVLEAFEKDDETKNIPIIIVSVKAHPQDVSRATERYKVSGYIIKPFANKRLLAEIERVTKKA